MNEITYTPGRLAKKIGVSRRTLLRHLEASGLMSHCFRTLNGHLRIPYKIAVQICSPEALAIREVEAPRRPKLRKTPPNHEAENGLLNKPENSPYIGAPENDNYRSKPQERNLAAYYSQVGKALLNAGITANDLIRYYYHQQQGARTEPPQKDDLTPEGETQGEQDSDDDQS